MTNTQERFWRVGQLSTATGLTVRTLHHYSNIGLLIPDRRTTGGHRLYSSADVRRLSMIIILRRAGLSLAEIEAVLDTEDIDVAGLIQRQTQALESALMDSTAFARRLEDTPIEELIADPSTVRELVSWRPQPDLTGQPIILLVYSDVDVAYTRLMEMFGFGPGFIARKEDGTAGYAELTGPTGNIRLHWPRPGLQAPDPAADPSSMTVVGVADAVAHAERAKAAGATIVRPVELLFGQREYLAVDHERHLWCFQER